MLRSAERALTRGAKYRKNYDTRVTVMRVNMTHRVMLS